MFELLTDFISAISSFTFNIPLWLQITIISIVIIALSIGSYFLSDMFDTTYMRSGVLWFVFVAILNLSTILVVFIYYSSKMSDINSKVTSGKPGPSGKKGRKGKKGKYLSCSYCAKDLFIAQSRSSDVMCELSTYTDAFTDINNKLKYFQNITNNGNTINYASFVDVLLLGNTTTTSNTTSITNFYSLMTPSSITLQLMKEVNDNITKASDLSYGTFRTPTVPVGYYPIGDSVYGGLETFELNSFSVNGDVLHPLDYIKIVSFPSFDAKLNSSDTNATDLYTIWRPVAVTITPKFLANNEKISEATTKNVATVASPVTYIPLGDICRNGTTKPQINEGIVISSNCCVKIDSFSELTLVFISYGDLTFADESTNLDYTKNNTWLIQNKKPNDIQIFSVWRTPLNTFITNCNGNNVGPDNSIQPVNNQIVNKSFLFNMYNNASYAVNKYGNIGDEYKDLASNYLQSIQLPKILVASILCKHYEIELYKEMAYYINYYQTKTDEYGNDYFPPNIKSINIPRIDRIASASKSPINSNPLFSILDTSSNITITSSTAFGYIMNIMKVAINENNAYNDALLRNASISLSSKNPIEYDPKEEMHLPKKLMEIYDYINTEIVTISYKIVNAHNLLDIVNMIFDNGLDARIAVDSIGIAQGGSLLNAVQETILIFCKIIMPPTQDAFIISDDCLGTFALDRSREKSINDLSVAMGRYRDVCDEINSNTEKYEKILTSYNQFNYFLEYEVGILCSHIEDNWEKLNDMNLEEFTASRIKSITRKIILTTFDIDKLIKSVLSINKN
jgi:hypothetical protein